MRFTFIILAAALTCSVAAALPPEGFENVTLIGRGKGSTQYAPALTYVSPVWRDVYQGAQFELGLPAGTNYASFGARSSLSPEWGDRDAYYARFDYVMLQASSLSFKWMHENWRYIASAKESIGLEYNVFFGFNGRKSGMYGTFGGYYRWLKQRWNDPWWSPLNLNTEDHEGYFVFVLGWQSSIGTSGSYFTFDVNNRDPFSYYTMDNLAFDLGLNIDLGRTLWRVVAGVRTSALTMGTGAISETYGSIGLVFY
ncbi:MAG TPA: hypothetical protein VFV50_15670 [Bdellovibrionales bacterium]|nr:hypothetical protein [Bdellovibrionales bacterium]